MIRSSYVSPRTRAQRTLELLEIGCKERLPWTDKRKSENDEPIRTEAHVQITEAIREWDYGEYEGLTSAQIRESRKQKGLGAWDIWRDGCPGGEYVYFRSFFSLQCNAMSLAVRVTNPRFSARSPEDVQTRLDALVSEIKEKYHRPSFERPDTERGDVLVVAHGHILRAFAMRWTGKALTDTSLILEAGGVGTLR